MSKAFTIGVALAVGVVDGVVGAVAQLRLEPAASMGGVGGWQQAQRQLCGLVRSMVKRVEVL